MKSRHNLDTIQHVPLVEGGGWAGLNVAVFEAELQAISWAMVQAGRFIPWSPNLES